MKKVKISNFKSLMKYFVSFIMIVLTATFINRIFDEFEILANSKNEIAKKEKIREIYAKTVGDLEQQKVKLNDPNYIEIIYRCKNTMIKKGEMIFDLSNLDFWNE